MGTIYTWKSFSSGDWSNSADWVQGAVPDSGTAAVVISGNSGVTIGEGESFTVGMLTLSGSNATLDIEGTLAFAGAMNTLVLNAATLEITGELANADIVRTGGSLVLSDATLSNDTYSGTLEVSYVSNKGLGTLYVENGLISSGGVINLTPNVPNTGPGSLQILDSETLNSQTILVGAPGGSAGGGGTIYSQNGTLTLGAKTEILQAATTTADGGGAIIGHVVNEGLILVAAGVFDISYGLDPITGQYDDNFVNAATGTIAISGGEVSTDTQSFDNAGLITVGSGGTFDLGAYTFINTGEISLASGSELQISSYDSLSLSELGSINGVGALIDIDYGSLDLGGGTLDIAKSGAFSDFEINHGNLGDGFIAASDGGTLTLNDATLSNDTFSGTLNILAAADNALYVENGLTGNGGVINLSDQKLSGGGLRSLGSETLNSLTIVVGQTGGPGPGTIYSQDGTLTLGAQTEILQAATTLDGEITGNIVNDGLISVTAGTFYISSSLDQLTGQNDDDFVNAASGTIALSGSGKLSVGAPTFDNLGLIDLRNGASVAISAADFLNAPGGGTLSGGTYEIESGSTLVLLHTVTTDAADIILSGTSSALLGGPYPSTITLEHSLTSVTSAGILQVLGGRNYVSTVKLTDAGQIVLGGGSFSAVAITVAAGGTASGVGTLGGGLINDGLITASGGELRLNSLVSGTGGLGINAGATLELAAGTAETVTFGTSTSLYGTLKLDAPAAFTGTLAGLALGDVIDIGGSTVAATSLSGTSLLITLSSGTMLSEILSSALPSNERFGVTGDGATGSDPKLYQEASASLTPTTLAFDQAHVGDAVASDLTIANSQAPSGYTEGLDASFASAGPGITASGSITTLAAGATNSTALQITLNTTAAGSFSSSAVVTLASDGAGTDGQSPLGLGSQTVAASGSVFNYATASTMAPVNFGIVHVGQAGVSQVVVLNNTAAPGLYSENLDGSFSGTSASITTTGSVSELAAGGSSGSALAVSLQTGTAGVISGSTTLNLTSDGTGIDSLGTTPLAPETIAVTGTVDNYATVGVNLISGSVTGSGGAGVFTLNLGSMTQGSTAPAASIGIVNTAKGTADLLRGTFALSGTTSAFTNNSGASFSGVAAGSESTGHTISLHTGAVGTFTETIVLSSTGYNASGYAGTLPRGTLIVTGTVTAAPAVMNFATAISAAGTLAAPHAPLTGGAAWLRLPDLHSGFAGAAGLFGTSPLSTPAQTDRYVSSLATTALAGFVLPGQQHSDSTKLLPHDGSASHGGLWGVG